MKTDTPYLLQAQLKALAAARTPLHMPGHKRHISPAPGLPFEWDITEIEGADDLHEAEGILQQAMARTAALCGAERTWYLVNGSTCGLLAGIRALAPFGSEVIVARNCHKAVYHAIELGALRPHWLLPPVDEAFGVYGSIRPGDVAAALAAHPAARCVVLTSPTYEGVLSDIRSIAEICHRHRVPLLVDEAHGAHYLPMAEPYGWKGGALACGADVVVQSAHKTLPSLTQTALLHCSGPLADPAELERQLDIFETSSPSYPLMASLDGCTGLLAAHGEEWFYEWRAQLQQFDAALCALRRLPVLCHGRDTLPDHPDFFDFDDGKILMRIGQQGAAELRRAGFEPEMICGGNVLAMTSLCDDSRTLPRLAETLQQLDSALPLPPPPIGLLPPPGQSCLSIAEALGQPAVMLPMENAVGKIAAEYLWAYPPGVPLLAPGERVTPALLQAIAALDAAGTRLHHTGGSPAGRLRILNR